MSDSRLNLGRIALRSGALLVTLFALSACADMGDPVSSPDGALEFRGDFTPPGLQDFGPALRAAERHGPALLQNPAVTGTGVGLDADGNPSVRVFLVHGQPQGIPDHLDGVPVSREVTGRFELRQDRTLRTRPAPIGFSVGHPDITAGTLGARVTNGTQVFILSNNHVMANSNNASLGDDILQPGAFDGGSSPGDVIGTLHDYQPFSFSSNNEIDAAIALVDANAVSGSTPTTAGYGAPGTTSVTASVSMGVQKYGRTTGLTFGTVAETNVTVSVCIETRGPFGCKSAATFVGQISISDGSFSDGGDSGSLIVTNNQAKSPVGLLFAGSSTRTLANPIQKVLDRFGVTIDPTVPDGSDPEPEPDPDPEPDPEPDPDPAPIDLSVSATKERGLQKADLTWSGATTTNVDIIRDGTVIATVADTGSYRDNLNVRGGGSYVYQVCEAGTSTCSAQVTATF
jgi:hypothetical protein